jgi:hypothetical protein
MSAGAARRNVERKDGVRETVSRLPDGGRSGIR